MKTRRLKDSQSYLDRIRYDFSEYYDVYITDTYGEAEGEWQVGTIDNFDRFADGCRTLAEYMNGTFVVDTEYDDNFGDVYTVKFYTTDIDGYEQEDITDMGELQGTVSFFFIKTLTGRNDFDVAEIEALMNE